MPPHQQTTMATSFCKIVPVPSAFQSLNARETMDSSVPTFKCVIAGPAPIETIDDKKKSNTHLRAVDATMLNEEGKSCPEAWCKGAFPTRIDNLSRRQSYRNSPNRLSSVLEEIEVGIKSSSAPPARNVVRKRVPKKKRSLGALLLLPLKKLRDKYVSCMLSAEGAGDFTVLVGGGAYITSPARFTRTPERARRLWD